jgi:flagellar hook assembly protein FlgD
MDLSTLSAITQSNESTSQTKKQGTLTQEDFFNLFVAQLKYQNPLEPMDNYQYRENIINPIFLWHSSR